MHVLRDMDASALAKLSEEELVALLQQQQQQQQQGQYSQTQGGDDARNCHLSFIDDFVHLRAGSAGRRLALWLSDSATAVDVQSSIVRSVKTVFLRNLYIYTYANDGFTKTSSGQTSGKLSKTDRLLCCRGERQIHLGQPLSLTLITKTFEGAENAFLLNEVLLKAIFLH
jgi:hypothetical protein